VFEQRESHLNPKWMLVGLMPKGWAKSIKPFTGSELIACVRAIMRRISRGIGTQETSRVASRRADRGLCPAADRAVPAVHSGDKINQSRWHFLTALGLVALRALGESSDPLVQTFTESSPCRRNS
jgi:hypothetical protein